MDKTTSNRERGAQTDAGLCASQETTQSLNSTGSGDQRVVLPPPEPCGLLWPVCPFCPGVRLQFQLCGHAACAACRRFWEVETVVPCPWPRSAMVVEPNGFKSHHVCGSHASVPEWKTFNHNRCGHA